MSINLEQIDELRKRAKVSYEEAKNALEKFNGDLVAALIYLEKENKINTEQTCEHNHDFIPALKRLIKKGNETKFTIIKKENVILKLSVNIMIIITVFAGHIVLFGLLLALITGHKFKFESNTGKDMKINATLDKVSDAVNLAKKKLAEDDVQNASTAN